jgi:DNA-binding NarL/FixJ family response regulator
VLRVAIVVDHPVVRCGLVEMLQSATDVQIVAAVDDCRGLPRDEQEAVRADLVILDLNLGGERPALEQIGRLSATLPVLAISDSRVPREAQAAMRAGASGYLTKRADGEAYISAIRSVVSGGHYVSTQPADLAQATSRGPQSGGQDPLSPREQEVLAYVGRGFTHQQAATRMGVSKATVDTYISRVRSKLGVGNKAELALAALRYLAPDP